MHVSRLSSKSQITIPKEVRDAIGLQPGDAVTYEVHDNVIELKRAGPFDAVFHKSLSKTMDEWATTQDEQAFHDL